jgi:hypothetical protein
VNGLNLLGSCGLIQGLTINRVDEFGQTRFHAPNDNGVGYWSRLHFLHWIGVVPRAGALVNITADAGSRVPRDVKFAAIAAAPFHHHAAPIIGFLANY